ncbi:MAG: magnesium transporter [Firmicutes bacterium]|nr:magnesium transporter [Candidatus Colimorpha enterica]
MEDEIIATLDIEKAVELAEQKKYYDLRQMLIEAEPADIALFMDDIAEESRPAIFRILPKELASEVFVEFDSDTQEALIRSFNDKELKIIFDDLYLDDTVDIIEEMPAFIVTRILSSATKENRAQINQLLSYPEDSAGSIMTTEFVNLRPTMKVSEALEHIRKVGIDSETVYYCYVTENRKLIGAVTALNLILSDPDVLVSDIMVDNVISVETTTDQQETAEMIRRYDFLALPVVDKENRLVGIVTVDDAIDVIQEEGEEDIEIMAAMTPSDKPYLKTSAVKIWLNRIPWLLLLMVSATFTGIIISSFEDALGKMVVLTAFIPMLMDTGGNAGSQSSVTIIRGISLGEITFSDILSVVWKEFRVSILCGIALAVATFGKIMLVDRLIMGNADVSVMVAFAVCGALALTVMCAKIIGCTLPMLAKKIGFDPAVMASPFITTIVDAVSLLLYFTFAKTLLGL